MRWNTKNQSRTRFNLMVYIHHLQQLGSSSALITNKLLLGTWKAECVLSHGKTLSPFPAASEEVEELMSNLSQSQLRVLQPKMDDSRMSKKVVCHGTNSDFISNLPDNVIDQILVRLPIREAVRTSVLSTNWRYKWTTITQLVFNDHSLALLSPHDEDKDKLITFINLVFLLHSGFIHKFELSNNCLPISSSIIDAWILFLSRKNIKEFVLKFSDWSKEKYKLPTCFFSAQHISTLKLHCCVLKPPPTFTGFSNLKSLFLHTTTFVDNKDGFECLISKCPLLERLTSVLDTVDHHNICSPNLKYLCLKGCFQDMCFENTPLLSEVSIHSSYLSIGNVVKVLSSLPNLRKFRVGIFSVKKFLSLSKIPEKLHFTCHHLNNLTLTVNFEDVNAICVTLCLLNSFPNLRELTITLVDQRLLPYSFRNSGHDIENFWEERTLIHWNMSRLQIVKIRNFSRGFELELEFIKLLLANSPMLEMLIIRSDELDSDRKGLQFWKELLIFPRASPKAKIKFLEEHEE